MNVKGRLWLEGDAWRMDAQPHVIAHAKRMFRHLPLWQNKELAFPNTPENCFNLQWFMFRYPLVVEHSSELAAGADRFRAIQEELDQLEMPDHKPVKVQFANGYAPRRYQVHAAEVYWRTTGLLVGDDVGLGKTVTAICGFTNPATLPAAVVVPTHLPEQWRAQINKFLPDLAVHVIRSTKLYEVEPSYRCPNCMAMTIESRRKSFKTERCRLCKERFALTQIAETARAPDVLILGYAKLSYWSGWLADYCNSVVFDEAQELRHAGSNKHRAARQLAQRVTYRMGASATPIYNYGGEMFNVMDVLKPDCLGTQMEFSISWCTQGPKQQIREPRSFGSWLREQRLMLRRTKSEVGRELPSESRITHFVSSDPKVFDDMTDRASELARLILSDLDGHAKGERMRATAEFDNLLRQFTGISKAPYVAAFCEMLLENRTPIILFGWHHAVYDIWKSQLRPYAPAVYTGRQSASQKRQAFEAFMRGETNLLICSLWSGAGLDGLQERCSTVVFGELDWSPGRLEQCIGRVLRDGQTDPVTAFFLLCDDGIDPFMAEVLGLKRDQVEKIRDPDLETKIEELSAAGRECIPEIARQYLKKKGDLCGS